MSMQRCFIGLGSNLGEPVNQLQQALNALAKLDQCKLGAISSFYASKPLGPQDQPDYVNAVVELFTELSPHRLLDQLQMIEQYQGRVRTGQRWGARTLDLDILLYGEQQIHDERLTVPHYDMAQRNFVVRYGQAFITTIWRNAILYCIPWRKSSKLGLCSLH